ncbi:MAG: Glu-tRNA(Gln) amidotransferase subunit GatD [Candidatus Diapherotrites archaeon]|nr:Glu-tRNA(Gln) amidotransferase subunit GatD [Candidatus Diapherotrites archaeon]
MTADCKMCKKFKVNPGEEVELESQGQTFTGILLPCSEKPTVELKLSNGYNAGFKYENIQNIKKIGAGKSIGTSKSQSIQQNEKLPQVTLLHTGGTILSRVDYTTGGVQAVVKGEDLINTVPEIPNIAYVKSVKVSALLSEDLRFENYELIASAIEKEIQENKNLKGIVITHGTDTLTYTSAAISFMFENLPVPIIFVASQRSSDRPSSDAAMNLISAITFAAQTDYTGVCICMHKTSSDTKCAILPGTKTRKIHTSKRDAFQAINDTPIALVDYATKKIEYIKKDYVKKTSTKMIVRKKMETKTGFFYSHPHTLPEEFDFFREKKYKGLILAGTGLGHIQINTEQNEMNKKAFQKLLDTNCIVGMTSQCLNGRVHSKVYVNARKTEAMGVIYCEDMLPETAFIKLAWLLGNFSPKETKELLNKNLRGEILERSPLDTELNLE